MGLNSLIKSDPHLYPGFSPPVPQFARDRASLSRGKLIYENGCLDLDCLSEAMVNAEEDYQVCVRMLARGIRSGAEKTSKRGRKEK